MKRFTKTARDRGLYGKFIVERDQGERASVGKQMGFRKDKWAFRRINGRYDSLREYLFLWSLYPSVTGHLLTGSEALLG